jgi:hypothetical protein
LKNGSGLSLFPVLLFKYIAAPDHFGQIRQEITNDSFKELLSHSNINDHSNSSTHQMIPTEKSQSEEVKVLGQD